MAWTTISNALVAVGAKPFATTIQALRDNAVAIADGDSGAPRVKPLAMVDFAKKVSHTQTTADSVIFSYPCARLRAAVYISGVVSAAASNFRIRSSSDGGSTWGAYSNIVDVALSGGSTYKFLGELEVDMATGGWSMAYNRGIAGGGGSENFRATGTMSVAAGANAIEFSFSASSGGAPVGNHTVYYVGTGT